MLCLPACVCTACCCVGALTVFAVSAVLLLVWCVLDRALGKRTPACSGALSWCIVVSAFRAWRRIAVDWWLGRDCTSEMRSVTTDFFLKTQCDTTVETPCGDDHVRGDHIQQYVATNSTPLRGRYEIVRRRCLYCWSRAWAARREVASRSPSANGELQAGLRLCR